MTRGLDKKEERGVRIMERFPRVVYLDFDFDFGLGFASGLGLSCFWSLDSCIIGKTKRMRITRKTTANTAVRILTRGEMKRITSIRAMMNPRKPRTRLTRICFCVSLISRLARKRINLLFL